MQGDHGLRRRLADVQVAHHVGIQQRHADDHQQHCRLLDGRLQDRRQVARPPQAIHHRHQSERQHGAETGGLRRRRKTAIQCHHHADQQNDEGQHARQHFDLLAESEMFFMQVGGFFTSAFIDGIRQAVFLARPVDGVTGKQRNEQHPGADPGQEQAAQRLFRGDRIQDHGDRWRQQDTERSASGDDAGRKSRRVPALPHLRNTGRTDRRTGCRRRTGHGGEQRAGEYVGNAEAARHLVQPSVDCRIQVLAGRRLANGSPLENK